MDKLTKLRETLASLGFASVDDIIIATAQTMLAERSRQAAQSIMETWTTAELHQASAQKTADNTSKTSHSNTGKQSKRY
jgi:HD-like signal output (HDOD) protein